jgi:hypothetical protein
LAEELGDKIQKAADAQKAFTEETERAKTEYSYLDLMAASISAELDAAAHRSRKVERGMTTGKITEVVGGEAKDRDINSSDVTNYVLDNVGAISSAA